MKAIVQVLFVVVPLMLGNANAQNDPFSDLDDRLKRFGCDYTEMQKIIQSPNVRLDFVAGRDEISVVRRYRSPHHEIIITQPNQENISFIDKTTLTAFDLPQPLQILNTTKGPNFLRSIGYRQAIQAHDPENVVMLSRVWSNNADSTIISNHVIYFHGSLSSVVWFCIP